MYAFDKNASGGQNNYRVYCPLPDAQGNCQHVFTLNVTERDYLISIGYQDEGVCWKTK